jgi:glycosyltransferase involved in cell wall biosynthesis
MNVLDSFVTVIVPVFNDLDRLRLCLASLSQQTYSRNSYEVIVVDNGSDDSPEQLSAEFQDIELQFLFENKVGSYAARNLGIQHAQGDIIAFTDSDCIPREDWIENGVKQLKDTKKCGVVAGKVTVFCQEGRSLTTAELFDKVSAFPQERYAKKAKFGVTANLFTLKSIFREVGFFDEKLVSAGDKEWGARVDNAGYIITYAEETVVQHPARNSIKSIKDKSFRVAYGLYQLSLTERLKKNKAKYKLEQLIRVIRDIRDTSKTAFRILYTPEISTSRKRQELIILAYYFRFLRIFESIRLEIGLPPKVSR